MLLTNCPDSPLVSNGAVVVEAELISQVGDSAKLRAAYPGHEFIDAGGALVMPGLVNVHHHFYSAFARGMITRSPKASVNFMEILENLWWKLDKALTLEDVRLSAAVSLVDSLKCGVTTVIDHHASFGAISGSLDEIASASKAAGVRACLCYETSDRLGPDAAKAGIEENRRFLRSRRNGKDGMLAGLFGLHASFTLSDDTLAACREAAGGAGFHVHVAEGRDDVEDSRKRYGKSVTERLDAFGVLGADTLAVHCIHVAPEEMSILADRETSVIHNPQSNMSNAVGASPLLEFLKRGVRVGIGTDGYTHDVFESAKAAGLLQRHQLGDPSVAWTEPYVLLLRNNPAIAGRLFDTRLGVLEAGAAADIIVVDYAPPTPLRAENLTAHLHFGVSGPLVRDSMIAGKFVMRERRLLTVDEEEIRAKSRELAGKLWNRL